MQPAQTKEYDAPALAQVVRWNKIAALLSMDVVVPFYELSGLRVPDPLAFRDLIRKLILDGRSEFPETDPAVVFIRREHLLEVTASVFGNQMRSQFEQWGDRIFELKIDEHVDLKHWARTLSYAHRTPNIWASLQIPATLNDEFLKRFLESIDTDEYDRKREEIYRLPLSDWDLHMYALHRFNDDDPPPTTGPDSYLYPTVKAYRGLRFWAWVLKAFTPENLTLVQQNATRIVQLTKHLAFIKDLPLPDVQGVPL